jgi:prepilin-type N-terminal cleavage/methylation domain-containing protein/prepilin-type processing-associated H-X9-DG protein
MKNRITKLRAFTLIELLVTIAIIAILAAIIYPVFARARMKPYSATCTSNLKQIAMSIRMYADDNDGAGPFTSCGSFWHQKLYWGGYGPRVESALYSCKGGNGSYSLSYYRGGHCPSGPGTSITPWQLDGQVRNPDAVMLVADARGGLPGTNDPSYFYDIPGNGTMTPAHIGVSNMAFVDGHVKGVTPQWLKEEVDMGTDADGRGAWYWWWR